MKIESIKSTKLAAEKATAKTSTLQAVPVGERIQKKSLAETVTQPDKSYTINSVFDLEGATVALPKNVTLKFSGKGRLKNGTIVGQDSIILADRRIFENVNIGGTWDCAGNAGWFADGNSIVHNEWGCVIPDLTDQSDSLQRALDSTFRELHFPPKCYYLAKTLVLTKEKRVVLHGSEMKLSLEQSSIGKKNVTILFSDKDICLLRIAVNESTQNAVSIDGGNFDVSLCRNYTQNCIEVRADEEEQRVWGLTINTNVKGKYNSTTGVGISINPVENAAMKGNKAFVTYVRINSNISSFGIGVKAANYMLPGTTTYHNWCTDMVVDGSIANCPLAVETNVEDTDIRATIQSGKLFAVKDNAMPLVRYTGIRMSMSSAVYDIRQGSSQYSNEYALEVTRDDATATAYGKFLSFFLACKRLGWPIVKGTLRGVNA